MTQFAFVLLAIAFLFIIYRIFKALSENISFDNNEEEDNYLKSVQSQIEALKNAGQWQEAFNAAKKILNDSPRSEKARCIYAKLLYDAGKFYDAIGHLNLVLRANPDNVEANILAGDCLLKTKQYGKAMAAYKKATESDKDNVAALYKLADLYVYKHDKRQALPIYKRIIELISDEREIKSLKLAIANIYFEIRDWPNLIKEANLLIEAYPNDKSILVYLKKAYLIAEDYENAIDTLKKLIDLDPYNPVWYEDVITLSFKTEDYEQVLEFCDMSLKLKGVNQSRILNYIAKAQICLKDFQKSLDCLKNAVQQFPKDVELKKTLAALYCNLNQYEEAIQVYGDLLEIAHPSDVQDLNNGLCDVYYNYGLYLFEHKDIDKAFVMFNHAIGINPSESKFYIALADINAKIRNYNDAISYYKTAIELSPQNSEIYIKLADIYYELENLLEAKKYYQDATLVKPDSAIAHASLGLIYAKQKNSTGAIDAFLTALDIEPLNVNIRYNLALAYELAMNPDKAITEYKRVLEIDPFHEESKHNLELLENMY